MYVENESARSFYEQEAMRGGWSVRQLARQIDSQFYERTALSKNKAAMLEKAQPPQISDLVTADEEVKDPLVLEFLGLRDEYSESDLEDALIHHLEAFLMELGNDFAFVGRQRIPPVPDPRAGIEGSLPRAAGARGWRPCPLPSARRTVWRMLKRAVAFRGGLAAVAVVGLGYVITLPPPDVSESDVVGVPVAAKDVTEMLAAAMARAGSKLGFSDPQLVQVLFGCVDVNGVLDPASTACPGSMIATIQDGHDRYRFALAVVGSKGLLVSAVPREAVMALPPATCRPSSMLAVARSRGLVWEPKPDTFLSYGPASGGGAEWSVTRDKVSMIAVSDSMCSR